MEPKGRLAICPTRGRAKAMIPYKVDKTTKNLRLPYASTSIFPLWVPILATLWGGFYSMTKWTVNFSLKSSTFDELMLKWAGEEK